MSRWHLRAALAFLLPALVALASPPAAAAPSARDLNGDAAVDGLDLVYLRAWLDGAGPAPRDDADLNGDAVVDEADLELFADHLYLRTPVATATVGPAGGTISAGGFSLAIPPGALTAPATIRVESLPSGAPDAITDRYFITGIPADADPAAAVTVTLPITVDPGPPPPLPASAAAGPITLTWREVTAAELQALEQSVSRARSKLAYITETVYNAGASVVTTVRDWGAWAADGLGLFGVSRRLSLVSDNFEILVTPEEYAANKDFLESVAFFLEGRYADYATDLGMTLAAGTPRTRVIFEVGTGNAGEAQSSKLLQMLDWIVIDQSYFNFGLNDELKMTLAHELLHIVQNRWDPRLVGLRRTVLDVARGGNDYLWWNEAVATWAEGRFGVPGAVPPNLVTYWDAPFDGMHVWPSSPLPGATVQETIQRHGYGMAGLVEWLVRNRGIGVVKRIYESMYNHWFYYADGTHPVEVVAAEAEAALDAWWMGDFLREYLTNGLYPGLVTPKRVDETMAKRTLRQRIFVKPQGHFYGTQFPLPDLGAVPLLVDPSTQPLSPYRAGDRLSFNLGIPEDGVVWVRRGLQVLYVPAGETDSLTPASDDDDAPMPVVTNVADLAAAGTRLLVVAYSRRHESPYTTAQGVSLESHLGNLDLPLPSGGVVGMNLTVSGEIDNLFFWQPSWKPDETWIDAVYPLPGGAACAEVTATPLFPVPPGAAMTCQLQVDIFGTRQSAPVPCNAPSTVTACGTLPSWDKAHIVTTFQGLAAGQSVFVSWSVGRRYMERWP